MSVGAVIEPLGPQDPDRIGPFVLAGLLGAGGMGRVYLGEGPSGRAAVKLVRPELAEDPTFRARFRREVAAAAAVTGPGIAAVLAADADAAQPWLASAYVPGPTLADHVADHGPLDLPRLRTLGAGIAEVLARLHTAGYVHRDLKPANVILGDAGPVVIDFGIAHAAAATRITAAGQIVGTPGYLAPELLVQGREPDPAGDVFALGATLAHAGTGAHPFGSGDPFVVLRRALHDEPDLGPIPDPERDLIRRCLAPDPADRPTAAAVRAELLPHAAHHTAAPLPAPQRAATTKGWGAPVVIEVSHPRGGTAAFPGPPSRPLAASPGRTTTSIIAGIVIVLLAGVAWLLAGLADLGGRAGGGPDAPAPTAAPPPEPAPGTPADLRPVSRVVATVTAPASTTVAGVSAGGDRVFITRYDGTLTAVDLTGRVLGSALVGVDPEELVVSADGSRVFLADSTDPQEVLAVDATTLAETARLPVGGTIADLAVGPDDRLYAATGTAIVVVDTRTFTVEPGPIPSTSTSLLVSPDGTRLYAERYPDAVEVYDAATRVLIATLPVPDTSGGLALSPDGATLYTAGFTHGTVTALDTATGTERFTVTVGDRPGALAASPHGDWLYVAVLGEDSLAVLDAATGATHAAIPVGTAPRDLTAGPTGHVAVTGPDPERVVLLDR